MIKSTLKYLILFTLIGWPVAHMALSKKGYINSWKFSGWGMYATTNTSMLKIKTIFLKEGISNLPNTQLPLNRRGDVLVLENDKYSDLPVIKLDKMEVSLLKNRSNYLRARYNNQKVYDYISLKKKILERSTGESFPLAILFSSDRRVDPKLRNSYQSTKIYLYNKGSVEFIGIFNSNNITEQNLRDLLNKQIKSPLLSSVDLNRP